MSGLKEGTLVGLAAANLTAIGGVLVGWPFFVLAGVFFYLAVCVQFDSRL